jgi:regulator of nucleoside diphosphate kinase
MKSRRTPPTVVTLHAAVRVRDLTGGEHQELTLVSPREADVSAGRISVLAPLGTALKRLLIGSVADRLLRAAECDVLVVPYFRREAGARVAPAQVVSRVSPGA